MVGVNKMKENQKPLFYGNPISDYGIKNGKVDYLAFSQAFEKVLNNTAFYELSKRFEYELQGDIGENEIVECYQYYIIHFSDAAFIHKYLKMNIYSISGI